MWRVCVLLLSAFLNKTNADCDQSVRWLNGFEMDSIYGMWYSVGYAQHTPDVSDKPPDIGCVILTIDDVTREIRQEVSDRPLRQNFTAYNNRWYDRQPWRLGRDGSWPNAPINSFNPTMNERILRLVWIEDSIRIEQNYFYIPETPALWKSEISRDDEWNPENPSRKKYEVIRILRATPTDLVLHHCMDSGDGRVFSLIFKRRPQWLSTWDWGENKKLFYSYQLPQVYREIAVCSACNTALSSLVLVASIFYHLLGRYY